MIMKKGNFVKTKIYPVFGDMFLVIETNQEVTKLKSLKNNFVLEFETNMLKNTIIEVLENNDSLFTNK